METSKFTAEQRETAMDLLIDNGDLNILPVEDFMTSFEPYQVALMITQSGLTLEYDYVRVNIYYSDTQEADTMDDLISDDEIEEALQELQ